jgi:hypothetical protein
MANGSQRRISLLTELGFLRGYGSYKHLAPIGAKPPETVSTSTGTGSGPINSAPSALSPGP